MTSERGTRTTEALRGSTEATRSSGASLETRPGALDRLAGAARRMTEGVGFAASGPVDGAAFDKAGRSLTDLAVSRPDIPLPALARGLVARGEVDRGEPRIVAAAEADLDAAGLAPAADPISRTFLEIQAQGQGRPTPAAAAMRKALQEGRCDAVTAARGFEAISCEEHARGRGDVAEMAARAFAACAREAQRDRTREAIKDVRSARRARDSER